ncbi:MAG: ABC transporter permease [Elainellaceae cyanobacterium]
MSFSRLVVIAVNAFREVIRDRILYLVALYGVGFVVLGALLPRVAANTQDKMLMDMGLAAIALIGLVTAILVGTGLVNKEITKRTIYVLMAKPVTSVDLVVGKHLGLTAVLGVLLAAMTVLYLGQLSLSGIAYPSGSLLLAVGYTLLELSLITAVAILFGVITSPLLAALLTLGVYLVGQLSPDLIELSELIDSPALTRLTNGLYLVLPDLSRLNWRNQAVYGLELMPEPAALAVHALYGLLYIVVMLAIASAILSRREF